MPIWASFSVSFFNRFCGQARGASGAKNGTQNSNFVFQWGSSSEELPKTIHANSSSGITKNVYFQPGRSWQQGVQVFGPITGKYPKKSLIKYDRLDGSSPVHFPAIFPQGVDACSWLFPVHAQLRRYQSQVVLKHSRACGSRLRARASRHRPRRPIRSRRWR